MQETFVGLMSGTSLDGIDAVAVRFREGRLDLLAAQTTAFSTATRTALLALIHETGTHLLDRLGHMDQELGELLARAALQICEQAGLQPDQVAAIGSHGQTVLHRPDSPTPFTLQIGDPNIIAERTGITTVADLRRRDMAAGGQGAPLVPAFHAALFSQTQQTRAVVNIGGMANVTLLPKGTGEPITGFDTGPGNVLLDTWIQQQRNQPYDRDGAWAGSGNIDGSLLATLLSDPYFELPPPKSTGREHFNAAWLQARLAGCSLAGEDIQATLVELTAASLAQAIAREGRKVDEVIVCGGGAHNPVLMNRLAAHLPDIRVGVSDEYGLAAEWVEAVAFAWLAKQTLAGHSGNIPSVTGARRPVVLGGIYPSAKAAGK